MRETKKFVETLKGKPLLIYGLGKTGGSLVCTLHKAGAALIIGDDNADNLKGYENIDILDITTQDFSDIAALILSPGVPLTHPAPHDVVIKAQNSGVEVIGDIELFFRIHPNLKSIGVTGTNGKSTTVSLLSHILTGAGIKNVLGGNIGTPMLTLNVQGNAKPEWVILEMSSYQIDLCPSFRPDISAILNVTADHIDRHGTIEHYAEVKERILQPKEGCDSGAAIICANDTYTQEMLEHTKTKGLRKVIETSKPDEEKLLKLKKLSGVHNHQNIACAHAIAQNVGVSTETIWQAIETFRGLDHRQYSVRTINGVAYINDSKATNAASSAMALGCQNNIFWILGGRKKETELQGLEEYKNRIEHAFLIGETTDAFAIWCAKYKVECTRCYTMENAVSNAHIMAQEKRGKSGETGVVLLSPACASFDQYVSFEERGDHFSKVVKELKGGGR